MTVLLGLFALIAITCILSYQIVGTVIALFDTTCKVKSDKYKIYEVYNKEKDRTYYWAKVLGFKLFWVIPIYTTFEVGFADYGGMFWLTKSSLIYDLNKRHQDFKDQVEEEKFIKFSRKNSQLITTNND